MAGVTLSKKLRPIVYIVEVPRLTRQRGSLIDWKVIN